MAITTNQLNATKATIVDRTFLRYTQCRLPLVRIAIQIYKNGNATQREAAMHTLKQAYTAAHGVSPIGVHHFKHWLREALLPNDDDLTNDVTVDDALEAGATTVT